MNTFFNNSLTKVKRWIPKACLVKAGFMRIIPQRFGNAHVKSASLGFALFLSVDSFAVNELEKAKQIHDRIAGVPPSEGVLQAMRSDLLAGDNLRAAYRAMDSDGFYNVTLKSWAAPWTNRDFNVFVPLNDYIATVVGLVRDSNDPNDPSSGNVDFRTLLYDDVVYLGRSGLSGIPAYSVSDNDHYEALESNGVSLKDELVSQDQSAVAGIPSNATAGVVTSRAAARAFFIDGTNRANFRFTLINHLCVDLEQVHDVSRVPDRIRQDVSRSPGGDARVFLNNCIGCHNGMDPLAQAFAYYDYDYTDLTGDNGRIVYNDDGQTDPETGTRVNAKYHINSNTFPYGFVTPDDQWDNYWREGPNAVLGWDDALPGSGNGAKSMMQELAHSEAFASCQVDKVFRAMCLRDPKDASERAAHETILDNFHNSGYNIKRVFAETALFCAGVEL